MRSILRFAGRGIYKLEKAAYAVHLLRACQKAKVSLFTVYLIKGSFLSAPFLAQYTKAEWSFVYVQFEWAIALRNARTGLSVRYCAHFLRVVPGFEALRSSLKQDSHELR